MKRRDCLRLLAIGLVTGLLPACFGVPHQASRPVVAEPDEAAGRAAAMPGRPLWSPYAQVQAPESARPVQKSQKSWPIAEERPALAERPRGQPGAIQPVSTISTAPFAGRADR